MTCRLTMALVSESQEGNIGGATLEVPKHQLESGAVRLPFGSPEPVLLFQGECEDELLVRFQLTAVEVDTFIDDVGKAGKDIRLEMPPPGTTQLVREVDIDVGVRESPGIRNNNAIFTLRVRLELERTG